MSIKQAEYYLLDVFTDEKYGGNPLAIFPDASAINEHLFQKIAREMNLSETVFLFPPKENSNYSMRIFTPEKELPTAGHPTVGTAYYMARMHNLAKEGSLKITLNQPIGSVDVFVEFEDHHPAMVTMHHPLPVFGPTHNEKAWQVAELLSLDIEDLDDLPIEEVSCGNNTLIVPLKSVEALGKIRFRPHLWDNLRSEFNKSIVYTFTKTGVKDGDVQGRMFGPEVGILEDPATGSANGPLISYLTKHQLVSGPILSLQGCEMGRRSKLHLDADVDSQGNITAVKVGGKCVFVGKGFHFLELM